MAEPSQYMVMFCIQYNCFRMYICIYRAPMELKNNARLLCTYNNEISIFNVLKFISIFLYILYEYNIKILAHSQFSYPHLSFWGGYWSPQ